MLLRVGLKVSNQIRDEPICIAILQFEKCHRDVQLEIAVFRIGLVLHFKAIEFGIILKRFNKGAG